MATKCQYRYRGSQVNKFEQASSLGHQMSSGGSLYSEVPCPKRLGWLYGEVLWAGARAGGDPEQ